MTKYQDINWAELREKLPFERTDEQKKKRKDLFKRFDPNGNGILSLAEVTKGIRDELGLEDVLVKAPVDRAFHKAKSVNKESKRKGADDYIDLREFRLFLSLLRQYFEYHVAFERIDESGDHRLDLEELEAALPKLEQWVGKVDDVETLFKQIDTDGHGKILFHEFCEWATSKNLDLDDDDD